MVKLSLDCATPECFRKLDRPLKSVDLYKIFEGIRSFKRTYKGSLILEILMVPGINTTDEEIEALNTLLPTLGADRIDIGTVDRPPAYPIEPLEFKELYVIAKKFDSSLPIHIASRRKSGGAKESYTEEEIISTLAKRPLTLDEIEALFDKNSLKRFNALLKEGKIETKELGGFLFYGTGFSGQKVKNS